jgi:serine phosphatase RsbU (regulator of sigma subunit)
VPTQAGGGGDIVCVADAPSGVRILIGDVMGHGPSAARTAADVLGAFRDLARLPIPLRALTLRLHGFVAGRDGGEEFVTALIIAIPRDGSSPAEIICCGHPPPLLLRGARASSIDALPPAPPLGLLELTDCQAASTVFSISPGDGLLLYTDGVTEATDARGHGYPLADRAQAYMGMHPPAFLDALRADLLRHAGGALRDDATILLARLGRFDDAAESEA